MSSTRECPSSFSSLGGHTAAAPRQQQGSLLTSVHQAHSLPSVLPEFHLCSGEQWALRVSCYGRSDKCYLQHCTAVLTLGPMGSLSRSKLSTVSSRPKSSMSPSSLWGAAAASAWVPSVACPVPLGSDRPFSRGAVRFLLRMYLVLHEQHGWAVRGRQRWLPPEGHAQRAATQAACHACLLWDKPKTSLADTG